MSISTSALLASVSESLPSRFGTFQPRFATCPRGPRLRSTFQETHLPLSPAVQRSSRPALDPEAVREDDDSILRRLWAKYCTALDKNPIPTKSATSFFGFMIGDLCAQAIFGADYDVVRTLRLVLFGLLLDGPVGHLWYTTIDRCIMPEDPKSTKAVLTKMLLDQFAWAPFFTCVFLTFIDILKGHPETIPWTIHEKLPQTLMANYTLWPLAHMINFRFIPSKQRILYNNAVQICWTGYLSYLLHVKLR